MRRFMKWLWVQEWARSVMVAFLVVVGLILFVLGTHGCCTSPAVKAGAWQTSCMYEEYVILDLSLKDSQKTERREMARNLRVLVGASEDCKGVGR